MAKKPVKIKIVEVEENDALVAASEKTQDEDILPEGIENDPIPKSSCALWSILLLLFIILLAIIGSLFYLKNMKLNIGVAKSNQNSNSIQSMFSPVGDELTIKMTEAQIQSAINADDANFPLKKAKIKVNPDKIILSGKTGNSFFALSVEVGLVPKVESGKVKFDITEIKSAGLKAPNSISEMVNNNLGQYLDRLSSSVGNIEVTDVKLDQGFMSVSGKQQ